MSVVFGLSRGQVKRAVCGHLLIFDYGNLIRRRRCPALSQAWAFGWDRNLLILAATVVTVRDISEEVLHAGMEIVL